MVAVPDLAAGDNVALWAKTFRRCAANVDCKEDLTAENDTERKVSNTVVLAKVRGHPGSMAALAPYLDRDDEKVCLLLKVEGAAMSVPNKLVDAYNFLSLSPRIGCSLAEWALEVKRVASAAGVKDWILCLAVFERGVTDEQRRMMGTAHHAVNNWGRIIRVMWQVCRTGAPGGHWCGAVSQPWK